jgi:hypothetical protein
MVINGEVPTSIATVYTVPSPSPGVARSGSNVEINLFRCVNESAAERTLTIYLNVNGTARALTPVALILPIGAAWDDVPVFQLKPGDQIQMEADGADVVWTINAYFVS